MKCFLSIIILLAALATLPSRTAAEDLSTSGWRLWPDRDAAWTNDTLYLPSEIKLDQMPVNPPTDGWPALNDRQGVAVTLPSTVEEHYWGKFGTRPYAPKPSAACASRSSSVSSWRGGCNFKILVCVKGKGKNRVTG